MSNYGIRYVVIDVGSLDDKATEEDVDSILMMIDQHPFQAKKLSDEVSDKLTIALLQEQGAL